ncbi:MAG: lytic transglycosylase domain-containing protein [Woeseiaceae bacterium]|nr:lytic transglycosylase domain-containing protein [Woeseiaceae bacterium]
MRSIAALLCLLAVVAAALAADDAPDPELIALLKEAAGEADSFADEFDAQVWLTDMSRRLARQVEDPEERITILRHVHYEATRADLAPELVLAVIDVESNFDRFAISHVGARGLMQVMPFWVQEIGRPEDNLMRIGTNLRYGCTILKYYIDMEDGDLVRALGRYNGSLGSRRYPNLVLDKLRLKWFRV